MKIFNSLLRMCLFTMTLTSPLTPLFSAAPKAAWEMAQPYLMPQDHPIKAKLDAFFSKKRITFSEKSLKEAGFSHYHPRMYSRLVVAKHPQFPGYVFKIYMDVQRYHSSTPEWKLFALRAEGADLVREEIKKQGWEQYFKVPKKWLYALPRHPKPPQGYATKYFILVQEDMDLMSSEDNRARWSSDLVTHEDLTRVHHLIQEFELNDCAKVDNIPFAKDGRIAFIDTQTFYYKDISWESLNKDLSPANREFWKKITKQ